MIEPLIDSSCELYAPLIGQEQGGLLVFSQGQLVHQELSEALKAQGVIFSDLSTAAREHPELVQQWLNGNVNIPKPLLPTHRGELTIADVRSAPEVGSTSAGTPMLHPRPRPQS